jgi:ABC-type lipoprotein export system ATPase subunit
MLLLRGIKKSFDEPGGGRLPVLDVPEFHLAAGEQVVLLGRSGSGKTTLLHVIAGISTPDAGVVAIDGVDIARLGEAERDRVRAEKVGYIFQTFNLLQGFSALENVMLGMTFAQGKRDEKWAKDLLARVGLGHRLRHKPGTLSVGEQQRVAVARALANRPRLLLADEPTASVDSKHQQEVIDLIRSTCVEESIALFLVTHAPEVAGQFARVEQLEQFNRVAALA